jgi:ubiquinone/menaquinone biosynthesis C-methylase UbiE
MVVSLGQWRNWLCLAFNFIEGKRVLEIGFGTGILQKELVERDYETYGLEYSSDMHRITRQRLEKVRLKSSRVQADGMMNPFCDDSFDSVVATFPEQYIANQEALNECSRVLKPDTGVFIIIGRWIELKSPWIQSLFPVFYRRVNPSEMKELESGMLKAGLSYEVKEVELKWVLHRVIIGRKKIQ